MSNSDVIESVDGLIGSVDRLRLAAESQAASSVVLAESVKENNELAEQNRKILGRVSKLMIAKIITLALLVIGAGFMWQLNQRWIDCTDPDGKCKARSDAVLAQYTSSFGVTNEAQRMATEIPIARAKGDTINVDMRTARLSELQETLRQIRANVVAVNNGRPMPYPDATDIEPITTPTTIIPSQ